MMSLVQPAPVFNFMVTLWDVQGPSFFGSGSALGAVASAAINIAGQFLTGAFSECQGLDADFEIEAYNEGGRNASPHKLVTRSKYQNLVLKRGVTFNPDLWDWGYQIAHGASNQPMIRKSGMVVLFDRGGPNLTGAGLPGLDRIPVAAWKFDNGVPERMHGPTLNAKQNEIAIETLEISHEGLSRVSLSMIPGAADLAAAFGGAVSLAGSVSLAGASAGATISG
jgi:phage tail-like protein